MKKPKEKKFPEKKVAEPKKKNLILRLIEWKLSVLDFLSPLSFVALRLYVALIFWRSGLTKIVDFDTAILLFENEYMTHKKITLFGKMFLTPEMAAYGSTFGELVLPILLIIGLAGRFAAFGLLVMTAIIQFTYTSSPEHMVWTLMLLPILMMGPGKASWDHFIKGTFYGNIDDSTIKAKLFAILCTLCLTLYAAFLIFTDIVRVQ